MVVAAAPRARLYRDRRSAVEGVGRQQRPATCPHASADGRLRCGLGAHRWPPPDTVRETLKQYPDVTVESIINAPGMSTTERNRYIETMPLAGFPKCATPEVLAKQFFGQLGAFLRRHELAWKPTFVPRLFHSPIGGVNGQVQSA